MVGALSLVSCSDGETVAEAGDDNSTQEATSTPTTNTEASTTTEPTTTTVVSTTTTEAVIADLELIGLGAFDARQD